MKNLNEKVVDSSTEAKIKEAARKVFTTKGYAGARTRDIAEAAGINLALLNYYFRSKEKLFQLIMMETVTQFLEGVKLVLLNEHTSLREKTEAIATNYIDMLLKNPELPVFMLSEIRNHPTELVNKMGLKGVLIKSAYFKQLKQNIKKKGVNPVHYFINTMAMIVFPFIGRPLLKQLAETSDETFEQLMQERKKLIVDWLEAMLTMK